MRALSTAVVLLVAWVAEGCSADAGPQLSVSDVTVYAPLTSNGMAVAYLTIHNHTNELITIDAFSSPGFSRVTAHETTLSHGVARMSAIESIDVPAGGSLALVEGGTHLMLMDPVHEYGVGAAVSLHLHYADDGLLIVDAVLLQRLATNESF